MFLFMPYTLLLLTSQWLQSKSNWKIFSWVNNPRLTSFLDAYYHAPYKPQHRYWTGVLLLARLALLLASTYPKVSFLIIQCCFLGANVGVGIVEGTYRMWYLKAFFLFNLGLLAVSTYQVNSEFSATELSSSEAQRLQSAVAGTMVTASLVAFLGIATFHIKMRISCTRSENGSDKEHIIRLQESVRVNDVLHVSRSYTTFRSDETHTNFTLLHMSGLAVG